MRTALTFAFRHFQAVMPATAAAQSVRAIGEGGEPIAHRHHSKAAVTLAVPMLIAPGERIRFTANVKSIDGKHRLNNGAVYTVSGTTERGDLRLENGWGVGRDVGHINYGYVTTSHSSQGRTVDRVLLCESAQSLAAAGAEQFYVSISRARNRATIYTDDVAALRAAVQESQAGLTASELAMLQQRQLGAALRFAATHRIPHSEETAMVPEHLSLGELAYGAT